MARHVAAAVALFEHALGQLVEFGLAVLHELFEVRARLAPFTQRAGQLRHHRTDVTDQRHVDRAVDADCRRVLFDQDPLALRFAFVPVAPAPEVHGLAQFGGQRQNEVAGFDRLDRRVRKHILEGAVLEPLDIAGAARGLDHRAVHLQRQFAHRVARLGGVHRVAHEEDRPLGLEDQFGRFGDPVTVGALFGQAIALGRQHRRHVEFFEDHVAGIFDVSRPRRARHRDADRLADHFVGLVGVLDRTRILDRSLDHRLLADELDAPAPHAPLGHARTLAAEEDDRRILDLAALDRGHHVGKAWPERAEAQRRLAGDAAGGFGHETGRRLVVRRNHRPAARFGFEAEVDEVGVWNPEQRLDALGLEQVEDALVHRGSAGLDLEIGSGGYGFGIVVAHFSSLGSPRPM